MAQVSGVIQLLAGMRPAELHDLRSHLQRQHAYGSQRFRIVAQARLSRRVTSFKSLLTQT
jgi:hypothetical protein